MPPTESEIWARRQVGVRAPITAFAIASLFIMLVGFFVYQSEHRSIRAGAEQQLGAVADIKVEQIATWINVLRIDAAAVSANAFLVAAVKERAAGGRGAAKAEAGIREWLNDTRTNFGYRATMLVNPAGYPEIATQDGSLTPNALDLYDRERAFAAQAVLDRVPVLSRPHRDDETGVAYVDIDIFAPLVDATGPNRPVIGLVYLKVDVGKTLFPRIQSWPTQSPSAESLLVEKVGDQVVFLNELRHRPGVATTLTASAETLRLPAAMAVRGTDGVVEGLDYRGIPVIAAIRPIANTHWYLITKIDADEIYAPVRRIAAVVSVVAVLFVTISAIAVGYWWRQNRRRIDFLVQRYEDNVERQSLMQHVEFLAKYANDIIILLDGDGRIVHANDRARAAYGYANDELLGMPFIRLFADEAVSATVDVDVDALLETLHRRRDGSTFPVEISMRTFTIDKASFSQIIGRDITERRNTEAHLRLVSKVFEDSNEAIVISDARNTILSVSKAFTELTGFTPEEVIGQNPRIFKTGNETREFYRAMWKSIKDHGRWRGEISGFRKNGEIFPKWMSISAVRNEAREIVNFIGIFSDISALKAAEARLIEANTTLERKVEERTVELAQARDRAEDALRAKSEFLAVMSHEIRTPMNGVLGMVRLMLDTVLDAQQRDYAETIQYSAEALLTILNDILDFSKLEAGRMELEHVGLDIERLVVSVTTLMGSRAREKGLSLDHRLGHGLPHHIEGDPTRLRQVLINLVGNAIKFTDTGRVTVDVAVTRREESRVELRFAVTDTGIGIPEQARDRLFARFSQVDASISRQYGGTGLGLYICRQIVEVMGGEIGVDSTPGQGSTFWFSAAFDIAEGSAKADGGLAELPHAGPLRILLAEDNLVNQKVALGILAKRGHHVTVANDGAEAVTAVRDQVFDVVLMDMQMPHLDGIEATRRIRASGGTRAGIPIIAMTANVMAGDIERCLAAGMNSFVAKPVDPAALFSALDRIGEGAFRHEDAPTPSPSRWEELVDRQKLDELTAVLGDGYLTDVMAIYRDAAAEAVAEIERAAATADFDKLRAASHDLKAMSGNLGLSVLHRLAEAVELASREDCPDEAARLAVQLRACLEETLALFSDTTMAA